MSDPVLHLIAGPNGAGKSTFYERILLPVTNLTFVNADIIAEREWPGLALEHGYEAAELAASERTRRMTNRESFTTETVFSHHSKVDLVRHASSLGYLVTLHIIMIPVELAVARVTNREQQGGHSLPESKIRQRYERLWAHIAEAVPLAEEVHAYDNTRAASPFRLVASFFRGTPTTTPEWPAWSPAVLVELTRH